MIETLARKWMLLLVCGALDAMIACLFFAIWRTDGPVMFLSWNGAIVLAGRLALGAGIAAFTAGMWRGRCWPLALQGLALSAFGVILSGFTGFRISFLTIALLIIAAALTSAVLGLQLGSALERGMPVLAVAVAAFGLFAVAFAVFGFCWIEIAPGTHWDLLALGAFFAFSAICSGGLGVRFAAPAA